MPSASRVSVIIPVYNDPNGITDTLDTLVEQTYPVDDYEIVVVDNGSTDETAETVRDYAERTDVPIRLFFERDEQGAAPARNEGLEHAQGELVFHLDADMTAERTWIADCVERMDETGALYAGCNVTFTDRDRALKTMAGRYELAFGFRSEYYINERDFALTGGLLTRREVFDRVGTFANLTSSGDVEFGQRVHAAGIDQHYFEDIPVYHPPRTTVRSHVSKHIRIGRGQKALEREGKHEFDRPLTHPRVYLPNAWPWNAREWAGGEFPDHPVSEWPFSTTLGLLVMSTIIDLSQAVGRFKGWYVDRPTSHRDREGNVYSDRSEVRPPTDTRQ